jgi:hypothetical protein
MAEPNTTPGAPDPGKAPDPAAGAGGAPGGAPNPSSTPSPTPDPTPAEASAANANATTPPADPNAGGPTSGDAAALDALTEVVRSEKEELKALHDAGHQGAAEGNEKLEELTKIVGTLEQALNMAKAAIKTGGAIDPKALRAELMELFANGRNFHNVLDDHHAHPVRERADKVIEKYRGKTPLDLVS